MENHPGCQLRSLGNKIVSYPEIKKEL
jgi:hypothetical protein